MKHGFLIIAVAALAALPALSHERLDMEESESLSHTIAFSHPVAAKTVTVDNVFGTITVIGQAIADVRLEGKKVLRAESRDDLERAKREVRLDIGEKENHVCILVDGPFRCSNGSIHWDDRDYVVAYDLTLQVPAHCDLVLKTVNDGDILVREVSGTFSVHNVNGKITMERIVGSGRARTVNGEVRVDFKQNPAADCSFSTVNGDVQAGFNPALSADFQLKTFNGDILSDFEVTYLPRRAGSTERENGKFVYRSDRFQGVRIGQGGPQIKMETLNGDIVIAGHGK